MVKEKNSYKIPKINCIDPFMGSGHNWTTVMDTEIGKNQDTRRVRGSNRLTLEDCGAKTNPRETK
jgi:hypothetical protein